MRVALSSIGFAFLRAAEGCHLTAYRDVAGKLTIGYGHLMQPDEAFHSITKDEAEAILEKDVVVAIASVQRLVMVDLQSYQADALISFVFNLGAGSLAKSTLLGRLNLGQTRDAAREFRRWHYAGGKPHRGLLRRRIAEELLFLGGHEASALDLLEGRL